MDSSANAAAYPRHLAGYRLIDAERYERRRYGSVWRRLDRWFLERAILRALGPLRPGMVVLDVPCGTGVLHGALAGRGMHVVGVDVSFPMLAVARRRAQARAWVLADARRLPFARASVDAVVCHRFLMHLSPPARVATLGHLAALARGPVVATISHPWTFKALGRALGRALGASPRGGPRLTRALLERELASGGLRLLGLAPVFPLLSGVWVARIAPA
jgi:SAM-dependent methyltransferase